MVVAHRQIIATGDVSHPYPQARETQSVWTQCTLCDRRIMSKDWSAHKNSKKHRVNEMAEAAQTNKENTNPVQDSAADTELPAEGGWGDITFGFGSGANDNGGFTNARGRQGVAGSRVFLGDCFGCGEAGHSKRDCPKSGNGNRNCFNCDQPGHNKVDCPEPPKPRGGGGGACYNCGLSGHNKVDCPEPPKPREGGGGGKCFNCNQYGHSKSNCPNERVMICRNCDDEGHMSKECPKPRDYSRVKCNNCGNMGHTHVRCKEPAKEDSGDGWGNTGGAEASGSGGWETPDGNAAGNDWANDGVDNTTGGDNWGGDESNNADAAW